MQDENKLPREDRLTARRQNILTPGDEDTDDGSTFVSSSDWSVPIVTSTTQSELSPNPLPPDRRTHHDPSDLATSPTTNATDFKAGCWTRLQKTACRILIALHIL